MGRMHQGQEVVVASISAAAVRAAAAFWRRPLGGAASRSNMCSSFLTKTKKTRVDVETL